MAEAQREPFYTDLKAEGCLGVCRVCQHEAVLLVCWCEQYEGCRSCVSDHLARCGPGRRAKIIASVVSGWE